MFGFVRQSTYDADIAVLERDNADLAKSLKTELATNDALDRTAKKYREERDALRAQLKVFTDRRDRAKLNLKQYRGSGAVAGPSDGAILNA